MSTIRFPYDKTTASFPDFSVEDVFNRLRIKPKHTIAQTAIRFVFREAARSFGPESSLKARKEAFRQSIANMEHRYILLHEYGRDFFAANQDSYDYDALMLACLCDDFTFNIQKPADLKAADIPLSRRKINYDLINRAQTIWEEALMIQQGLVIAGYGFKTESFCLAHINLFRDLEDIETNLDVMDFKELENRLRYEICTSPGYLFSHTRMAKSLEEIMSGIEKEIIGLFPKIRMAIRKSPNPANTNEIVTSETESRDAKRKIQLRSITKSVLEHFKLDQKQALEIACIKMVCAYKFGAIPLPMFDDGEQHEFITEQAIEHLQLNLDLLKEFEAGFSSRNPDREAMVVALLCDEILDEENLFYNPAVFDHLEKFEIDLPARAVSVWKKSQHYIQNGACEFEDFHTGPLFCAHAAILKMIDSTIRHYDDRDAREIVTARNKNRQTWESLSLYQSRLGRHLKDRLSDMDEHIENNLPKTPILPFSRPIPAPL